MHSKVLLLVSTEKIKQCAFAVDGISDQRQVVIKSLETNFKQVLGIAGATVLGDGSVALILDVLGLSRNVVGNEIQHNGTSPTDVLH